MEVSELIDDKQYYTKHFNRDEYPEFFQRYKELASDYFDGLAEKAGGSGAAGPETSVEDSPLKDSADGDPASRDNGSSAMDTLINEEVRRLLDHMEENWNSHRWKHAREGAMIDDKLVLTLYLAPAAVDIGTSVSTGYANALAAEWNRRYPDSGFKVGNYEDLVEGFKWKLKFSL